MVTAQAGIITMPCINRSTTEKEGCLFRSLLFLIVLIRETTVYPSAELLPVITILYKERKMQMDTKETYVDILVTSLKKKITILKEIEVVVMEQEKILKNHNVDIGELDRNDEEKGELLQKLEQADEGFETVYARVKEEFARNKNQYERQIKEMQGMIKEITDMTVKIQAQEVRNRQWMDLYFQNKKKEVRIFRKGTQSTERYNSHMANRPQGQSYFLDKKK